MTRQGCSTFSTDESNRILDRLAGLEKIITPDQIVQALVATNRVNRHRCKLSNEIMLSVVLAMGLFTTLPIRQVFKQARRMRQEEKSPPRSKGCKRPATSENGLVPFGASPRRFVRAVLPLPPDDRDCTIRHIPVGLLWRKHTESSKARCGRPAIVIPFSESPSNDRLLGIGGSLKPDSPCSAHSNQISIS